MMMIENNDNDDDCCCCCSWSLMALLNLCRLSAPRRFHVIGRQFLSFNSSIQTPVWVNLSGTRSIGSSDYVVHYSEYKFTITS